jgi:transglutaminase-like putative cysteine protease
MKFNFKIIFIIFILISIIFIGCIENRQFDIKYASNEIIIPKEKEGKMLFNVTIRINESSKLVRLWIPYPVSNEFQEITNYFIQGDYDYMGIFRESQHGNMILYAEWNNPEIFPKLNFSYDIKRIERICKNFSIKQENLPIDVEKYLLPTNLGPTNGEVKEIADDVTKGANTILEKAILVYDYLIEYGERDGNLTFCGDGDVCKLLKNLRGKCADFSSVFVALSRSVGIPSREIFGTRISKEGDITGSYHCHAEFYNPGYGWIPVDPSDVAKLMLNENLGINDDKVVKTRDYYFGIQSETYVDLSSGRDIILNPTQDGDPLNYFMYPYAEINSEPLDFISQEYLRYVVTYRQY